MVTKGYLKKRENHYFFDRETRENIFVKREARNAFCPNFETIFAPPLDFFKSTLKFFNQILSAIIK